MRLLLINPKFPESFWSFKWAINDVLPEKRAVNPPLGLATLAALCPQNWQVEVVDENVEAVPLAPEADIVGVCGMGVQFPRQRELLAYYRGLGYYVVAGGSYASLCREEYTSLADTVVAGEAEYIWKEFCRDYSRGSPKPMYHEAGTVDLTDSPVPRFDLLKLERYSYAALQYSRGCPYRCEFCDIIVMFGRKPRVKSLEQVEGELDELRKAGVRSVFFVDDNMIGDRPRAKELLRFLARYQEQHHYNFTFGTEASVNMAQDPELLELFRAANFGWVFIGIESPDPASLKETLKTQNLHEDALTSIRRIYSYGIDVLGGFIIGFDNDTLETFEHQYEFITASGIQSAMIGLLIALPHTPLYERMEREGRLKAVEDATNNTRPQSNIVPKNMSHDAMVAAYQDLYARLLADGAIARRIRNKVRYLRAPSYQSEFSVLRQLVIIGRLVVKGILPGGASRTLHFLASLPIFSPSRVPLVISDWIIGLSMRQFALHRMAIKAPKITAMDRHLASLHALVGGAMKESPYSHALTRAMEPNLVISLSDLLQRRVLRRAIRRLRRVLKHTHASITLHLDSHQTTQLKKIEHLLDRLARYGDRVFVVVDDNLWGLVTVDSSVFNLVMARSHE
ncbi:MAG: B12-binding domain-containing radical SAM protein [Rhodospirillales bacterium]|nr:B12-binding domain-containing radical SAM protein [Rhodospirillales bacterium]MDH3917569.1 B12-binding domain-containing radical SAM protein [Rhodospirillales bacterium]